MNAMTIAPAGRPVGAADNVRRKYGGTTDGLTQVERDVLDLADAGEDSDAISRLLHVKQRCVTRILRTFGETERERRFVEVTAASSRELLRAQLQYGQHCLPSALATALMASLQAAPIEVRS